MEKLIKHNQVIMYWKRLNARLTPIIGESLDFPTTINFITINSYRHLKDEITQSLGFLSAQEVTSIKSLNDKLISAMIKVYNLERGDNESRKRAF